MTKTSVKYALKEALVSGIATAAICFVIFIFIENGGKGVAEMIPDLVIGLTPTALICIVLQIFLRKSAVSKGTVPPMGALDTQVSYALLPQNSAAFVLAIVIIDVLLFACGIGGAMLVFVPSLVLGRFPYIVLKAVLSGIASAYSTFHGVVFFSAKYQKAFAASYVVSQSTNLLYTVPQLLHSSVIHIQVKALSISPIPSSSSS